MKTNKLFLGGMLAAAFILLGAANVMAQLTPPDEDFEVTQNKDGKTLTISKYKGLAKNIIIPAKLYGLPVTVIGEKVFMKKGLTSVDIPNSVTSIERNAFANNQLTGVTIPNSVISIEAHAFSSNKLTSITIPDGVAAIGNQAFYNNQLTSVTIPDSVTSIGENAFANNQLTSLVLGKRLNSIQPGAFSGNQLTNITIAKDVRSFIDNRGMGREFPGINTGAGFDESFINFYESQKRRPGTYVRNGPIWSKQ